MILTIKPTKHFFMAGDVMVRLWEGADDQGQSAVAFVAAVGFAGQAAAVSDGLGLVSIPPPSPEDAMRWAEKIIKRTAGEAP